MKRTRTESTQAIFSLVMTVLASCLLSTSPAAEVGTCCTAITNVRVFDGNAIIPQSTVVFGGGVILDVNEAAIIPEDAEVIDGNGMTLLPGLIDAHVHAWQETQLQQYPIFGVTSVIDMFTDVTFMQRIKDLQATDDYYDMATFVSAGTLVTAPGGHGTQFGVAFPTLSDPEHAHAFVDNRVAEGSDFIKAIFDDFSSFPTMPYKLPTLSKETISALITAAHSHDKLIVLHVAKQQEARWVIEAGADGLVHLFWDGGYDPNFGTVLAQHNAFVIPTLSVLEAMSGSKQMLSLLTDPNISPYLTQADIDSIRGTFRGNTRAGSYQASEVAVQQLMDANVPILAGTDADNPGTAHGVSLHRELVLLVQAGLSPVEALRAATLNPAVTFNLSNRSQIKPGFYPDLVLVNGNPTEDIQTTRNIVTVWKNGVKVDRESYRERIAVERNGRRRR